MSAKPKREPHERQPRKTALITGVTGQDGSYLAELLRREGLNFGMRWEEANGEVRVLDEGSAPATPFTAGEEL